MQCPASSLYACRCAASPRIRELPNVSYYPASRMVRIGNSLHTLVFPAKGPHYVEAMMCAISSGRVGESTTFLLSGRVCRNLVATIPNHHQGGFQLAWWTTLPSNSQALTLQRWLRRLRARAERRLALAMALHPRLGRGAGLSVLCADQVGVIGKMI